MNAVILLRLMAADISALVAMHAADIMVVPSDIQIQPAMGMPAQVPSPIIVPELLNFLQYGGAAALVVIIFYFVILLIREVKLGRSGGLVISESDIRKIVQDITDRATKDIITNAEAHSKMWATNEQIEITLTRSIDTHLATCSDRLTEIRNLMINRGGGGGIL